MMLNHILMKKWQYCNYELSHILTQNHWKHIILLLYRQLLYYYANKMNKIITRIKPLNKKQTMNTMAFKQCISPWKLPISYTLLVSIIESFWHANVLFVGWKTSTLRESLHKSLKLLFKWKFKNVFATRGLNETILLKHVLKIGEFVLTVIKQLKIVNNLSSYADMSGGSCYCYYVRNIWVKNQH